MLFFCCRSMLTHQYTNAARMRPWSSTWEHMPSDRPESRCVHPGPICFSALTRLWVLACMASAPSEISTDAFGVRAACLNPPRENNRLQNAIMPLRTHMFAAASQEVATLGRATGAATSRKRFPMLQLETEACVCLLID